MYLQSLKEKSTSLTQRVMHSDKKHRIEQLLDFASPDNLNELHFQAERISKLNVVF